MPDGVSHLCHTGIEEVARPAGLEPATPGLEGEIPVREVAASQQVARGAMPRCRADAERDGLPHATGFSISSANTSSINVW